MNAPVFNEKDHTYIINGIYVPGCTTVTGLMPKQWLAAWAAKEACGYLEKNWVAGRAYESAEITKLLKEAKAAHRRKKEEAADKGTTAHAFFEEFVKAAIKGEKITLPIPADKHVANSVRLFLEWEKRSGIKWLRSEVVVGSEKYMFGGKYDAVGLINGKQYLIDFKTSSGIYYEMHVQTAGYQLACEEMGMPMDGRLLLWVPKTGNDFRDIVVRTPYALDRKCFLAALDIYHCLQDAEKILSTAQEAAA